MLLILYSVTLIIPLGYCAPSPHLKSWTIAHYTRCSHKEKETVCLANELSTALFRISLSFKEEVLLKTSPCTSYLPSAVCYLEIWIHPLNRRQVQFVDNVQYGLYHFIIQYVVHVFTLLKFFSNQTDILKINKQIIIFSDAWYPSIANIPG